MVLVELADGSFEGEVPACRLELPDQVRRALESTRNPFSTSLSPRPAAKWLLPVPGGPNKSTFAPSSSQVSPLARTPTRALDTAGTG